MATGLIFGASGLMFLTYNVQAFEPPEGVNAPMGAARGIAPGRVVWVHNADATSFDGPDSDTNATPCWWSSDATDQDDVEYNFL